MDNFIALQAAGRVTMQQVPNSSPEIIVFTIQTYDQLTGQLVNHAVFTLAKDEVQAIVTRATGVVNNWQAVLNQYP